MEELVKQQIASVFALALFSLTFPVVLVCAFFYGSVWGNFTYHYDEEDGRRALEKLWLQPCEKIIALGWKQRLARSQEEQFANTPRFVSARR